MIFFGFAIFGGQNTPDHLFLDMQGKIFDNIQAHLGTFAVDSSALL